MIKTIFHKTILSLFFLAVIFFSNAQTKITVKASVDKNSILIGERIILTTEADIPENEPIRSFDIDSLEHFEIVQKQKTDTTNTSNGTILKQVILITSFDSGHWVIPSFVLAANIATDSIPVDVRFSSFDPGQDYHDIKDIIEVKPVNKKPWWWYVAGGALLLLLLLIYLLRKKKKPVIEQVIQVVDPYEEAMKQLELLQKRDIPAKQYYSGLVDVLRLYVFRKKGILSLQKTTDDIILQLKSAGLDKEQFAQLSQALRLSDFVKFAKYAPAHEDNKIVFETIKNSIRVIEHTN